MTDAGTADPGTHWSEIWAGRDPASVIDVGGGASTLVDSLPDRDHRDLTVLDIAEAPLDLTRARLADRSDRVHFVIADITATRLERRHDPWHDRAVFHVAAFAPDGPEQCGGRRR